MTAIALPLGRRAEVQLTKGLQLAILLAIAAVLYVIFHGQATVEHADDSPVFVAINGIRDAIDAGRLTNALFVYVFTPIREAIGALFDAFLFLLESLSWIGVTAIFGAMGLIFVSWRTALVVIGSFLAFGLLGLWEETLETLALTHDRRRPRRWRSGSRSGSWPGGAIASCGSSRRSST